MEEGKYPSISLGNYNSLNINGNQLIKYDGVSYDYDTRSSVFFIVHWQQGKTSQ
jgi:hypothetical protein